VAELFEQVRPLSACLAFARQWHLPSAPDELQSSLQFIQSATSPLVVSYTSVFRSGDRITQIQEGKNHLVRVVWKAARTPLS